MLEILHLVPKKVGFDEARLVMGNLATLRPEVVPGLLEACRSIKVKRLFLYMAENQEHAWFSKLDLSTQDHGWRLSVDFIKQIHAAITDGIPHKYNRPGVIRNNPQNIVTHVGDAAHGGRYKPPQYGGDIERLLDQLVVWQHQLIAADVTGLIRAPLMHYYFELIHPFWDGNGRVGRVLEATVLHTAGFRYAPFAMARYYLEWIDQYFALFNLCRKQGEKKTGYPNTPFVLFHLEGMLAGINRLHDRVNAMVGLLLFENQIKKLRDTKELNLRQYAILTQVMERGKPLRIEELRRAPWYEALYAKMSDNRVGFPGIIFG